MSIITHFSPLDASGNPQGLHSLLEDQTFYVNNIATTPVNGVVSLAAGSAYTLRGHLVGRVEIGHLADQPTDDTCIILDGVRIDSDDESNNGIAYLAQSQSLIVTLARNKRNVIICSHNAEMADKQGACLYSENNLSVQGTGYLSVKNNGGHGIKGSELRLYGRPHIYASAIHDGIHGNSMLQVVGGYYYIDGANDAFGTGTTGKILVFDGKFRCFNLQQKAFDSKVSGAWFCESLDLITDISSPCAGFAKCDPETYFGAPSVVLDGTPLEPDELGGYNIITEGATSAILTGYFPSYITVDVPKVELCLNNAYLSESVIYSLGTSNLQINAEKDSVNLIRAQITSSNNLKVEVKSGAVLDIMSPGKGMSASELTIHDSNGILFVHDCAEQGMQGTDIYIADSADHKAFDFENIDGGVIAVRNKLGDICARLSGKGKKSNVTVKNANLRGILLADSISAEEGSSETTGINLDNSPRVFYKKVQGPLLKGIPMLSSEPFSCYPCNYASLPIIEP